MSATGAACRVNSIDRSCWRCCWAWKLAKRETLSVVLIMINTAGHLVYVFPTDETLNPPEEGSNPPESVNDALEEEVKIICVEEVFDTTKSEFSGDVVGQSP